MIPRNIFQLTTNNIKINDQIYSNIRFLKDKNPNWNYELLDEARQIEFLTLHAPKYLKIYEKFGKGYDVAKMDFFRYVLVYECGGLYLDLKCSFTEPLDEFINQKDRFLVSHWPNNPETIYTNWGKHPELSKKGEFINGVIISEARNPVLLDVIHSIVKNIENYSPFRNGVGGPAVLRLTGPVAYTLAIEHSPFRETIKEIDFFAHGLRASIFENDKTHMSLYRLHYGKRVNPVIKKSIIHDYIVSALFWIKKVTALLIKKMHKLIKSKV